ncbi:hypothetical protein [Arthrobacter sp. H5]|uniref:hypothetical protein n=1 Tax=Arthrobacter sp. H5 TaxID=1267973 RepID=UPI0004AE8DFB|nr:hypothetical protein [Arthrobacter sp. H5]
MAADRRQQRKAENLDILIGFLGFFAIALVVVIIAMEVSGQNAALWSIILLGVVLAIWRLFRARQKNNTKEARGPRR